MRTTADQYAAPITHSSTQHSYRRPDYSQTTDSLPHSHVAHVHAINDPPPTRQRSCVQSDSEKTNIHPSQIVLYIYLAGLALFVQPVDSQSTDFSIR